MLDMSAVGPMTRYVEDAELLLPVLAGPDGIDPFVGPATARSTRESPTTSLRCRVLRRDGVATPDAVDP